LNHACCYLNPNLCTQDECGKFDLAALFQSRFHDNVGLNRLLCFFAYFEVANDGFLSRSPMIVHRICGDGNCLNGSNMDRILDLGKHQVHIHTSKMEVYSPNGAFVDFANAQIHIGSVIARYFRPIFVFVTMYPHTQNCSQCYAGRDSVFNVSRIVLSTRI
jgi:hypothetical protein